MCCQAATIAEVQGRRLLHWVFAVHPDPPLWDISLSVMHRIMHRHLLLEQFQSSCPAHVSASNILRRGLGYDQQHKLHSLLARAYFSSAPHAGHELSVGVIQTKMNDNT